MLREQKSPRAYEKVSGQVPDEIEEEYTDPFEDIRQEVKEFVENQLAQQGFLDLADALRMFLGRYSVNEIYDIASFLIDEMLEQGIPPYPQELINMSWVSVAGDIEVESLKVFAKKT